MSNFLNVAIDLATRAGTFGCNTGGKFKVDRPRRAASTPAEAEAEAGRRTFRVNPDLVQF